MSLNAQAIETLRSQFPALNQSVTNGTLPVHFDNPAGTQVPQRVIDAVTSYYITMNANAGGTFATSRRSDQMMAAARQLMADFLNADRSDEIVFGPNMTTLAFGLSRAIGKTLQPGDEIVVTRMDHDANITPWTLIAEDRDLVVRWVDIKTEDCTLDMDSLEAALTDRTRLVATVHASNAVGTINPVAQIAEMAHAAGAYYVVDAVQSAPHLPLDVREIGCDFLLCSAYKFFGPHIGVMWGRYALLESLPAYKVRPAKDKSPYRWETGTPSYETLAGTMAALEYFLHLGRTYGDVDDRALAGFSGVRRQLKAAMLAIVDYERELVRHLIEVLKALPNVYIAGITDPARYHQRVPTVAFTLAGHTPDAVAEHLANHDIYVWSGNYYALEIMERLKQQETGGMVRVGLAHYNTHDEIDRLATALRAL
ncbi:MAG: cysteine desulfurase-like protein [Chloroflexi bacterium]|nr:cysteine desulfurase-like protein [Chloroflexota bacterium]